MKASEKTIPLILFSCFRFQIIDWATLLDHGGKGWLSLYGLESGWTWGEINPYPRRWTRGWPGESPPLLLLPLRFALLIFSYKI